MDSTMEMIGDYRITGRIGSGSFATVYLAQQGSSGPLRALKLLADNWSANEDVRERFLSEAKLLQQIADERFVHVYDLGEFRGQPYYVMDYADSGSFEVLRKQMVPPGLALRLCAEATRALEVLHRAQLVHRDVSPGNILLNRKPGKVQVLLADLGVAKSLLDEYCDTMTAGTPAYMALEQAKSTQLDQRSDLYSMGCVAYALLTSHPPFPVKTLQDLLSRNSAIGPAPIAYRLNAPDELDHFFSSVLSPDPNRRPQTAAALAARFDELANYLPGGEVMMPPPSSISLGNSAGSIPFVPSVTQSFSSIPSASSQPKHETPLSVLGGYLGKDRYRPAPTKETHSIWFWIWFWTSFCALTLFSLWLLFQLLSYSS